MPKQNGDIRSVFKLQSRSAAKNASLSSQQNPKPSHPAAVKSQPPLGPAEGLSSTKRLLKENSKPQESAIDEAPTSSLSPPPPSSAISSLPTLPATAAPAKSQATAYRRPPDEEIKGSSDGSDSESDNASLVDLSVLLQTSSSAGRSNPAESTETRTTPSTPVESRRQRNARNFPDSPLAVLPKFHFNMKDLAKQAHQDEAIEASSRRLKSMLAEKEEAERISLSTNEQGTVSKSANFNVLGSVVGDREDGGVQRVSRALKRTEATLTENRWYFFDTQQSNSERHLFPTSSIPSNWKKQLENPQTRYHTFVSGFAEDMVSYGNHLPDELLLWVLDEICMEPSEILRTSYANVVRESREQFTRLLTPSVLAKAFVRLGGTSDSTDISQKITPSPPRQKPKARPKDEWANLRTLIKLLSRGAGFLEQSSRTYVLNILLRMSVDNMVFENVDVFDLVQDTISRLCQYSSDDAWEQCVTETSSSLYNTTSLPSFRLKAVLATPCFTPHSCDLRQRLALCFFFDSLTWSTSPPFKTISIPNFRQRLQDPSFDTNPQTDYRELSSLISLLDIAIGNGRSSSLNLADAETEEWFNSEIDALGADVRDIMRNIGNPGAAFISRIEAKEVLELVGHRIADTLRTRPRVKESIFEGVGKKVEDLEVERRRMEKWVGKRKVVDNAGDEKDII